MKGVKQSVLLSWGSTLQTSQDSGGHISALLRTIPCQSHLFYSQSHTSDVCVFMCACANVHMNGMCQSAKPWHWAQHVSSGRRVKADCEGASRHMAE